MSLKLTGNFNRPRGKTLSSLDIFSIAQDISGPTRLQGRLLEAFNDHKAQQTEILASELQSRCNIAEDGSNDSGLISINHYDFSSQETDRVSVDEVSEEATDSTGDSQNDFVSDEDVKDLARHGLPSACIFVANLAATQTDDQLMKSLQSHFGKFGRLHVKIRRDTKSNPYSFCQFECDETARLALRDGRNAIIDSTGRRIRCEPAKVNRTLVLSKMDCNVFNENDARKILFGFGETETMEFARDGDTLPVRGTKEGRRCFVRFAYRQDAVDCYQYFRHHCAWTADWTSNFSVPNVIPRIQTVEIDPVSIFIGKLNPDSIGENELRARFSRYGMIVECNLVNRASKNGIGRNAFAFVKYEAEEMANRALEEENNSLFLGKHIHVQKREIHKKPIRMAPNGPRLGGPVTNNQLSHMDQVRRFGVPQSFPFSMEAVADLAARLSVQLAEQLKCHMCTLMTKWLIGMVDFRGIFLVWHFTSPSNMGIQDFIMEQAISPLLKRLLFLHGLCRPQLILLKTRQFFANR
ncbi:uncharacterized protein H6S33_002582 [Morchella sextelata]|uniref:uncharacterized protein n=1 Tax=Morchella sextelata TaxID=1174677 RepID=UPI001D056741|nr:uncharacterized protein H6S33_002582 [Morchella sextelata]KAH0607548.1 hypothetical protein H6S33_002582 [Morchella sextelata]